jgi:hypothetical protein
MTVSLRGRFTRCNVVAWAAALGLACGARSELRVPPGAAEAAAGDPAPPGAAACELLTLTFVGCDAERRAECEREYAAVGPATRAAIDRDAACFREQAMGGATAPWPPATAVCTPTAVPPALDTWEHWFHGGCQGFNGAVMTAVAMDPGFPACAFPADAGAVACFFGGTLGGR